MLREHMLNFNMCIFSASVIAYRYLVTHREPSMYVVYIHSQIPIRSYATYCLNWIGIYVYVRRYLYLDKWPIAGLGVYKRQNQRKT